MSSWNRLSLQAIPLVVIVSAVSCGRQTARFYTKLRCTSMSLLDYGSDTQDCRRLVTRLPRGLGVFTSLGERTAARLIFLFDFKNLAGVLIPTLAIAQ